MASNGTHVPTHVVWDWNGTLLDDNRAVLRAVNQICAHFDRPAITLEQWRGLYARPLTSSYEKLLGRTLTEQDCEWLEHTYHDAYRAQLGRLPETCFDPEAAVRLADGVPHALRTWRDSGRSQSLLSMWFHHELVPLVTELGLAELFDRVDGLRAHVGGGSKRDHLVEHLAAQGLDPTDVTVGDVADDADAATYVGARCVLVATGMMSRNALAAAGVPIADSIEQALRLIAR
jgi:phosphoglycolate phosphatase-like HAD superfamily hydrolase